MAEHILTSPLKDEDVAKLKIGDMIYYSGEAWTCRSRLQKAVFDEGWQLPFSIKERKVLIHVGPVIIPDDSGWKLVSFTPTSSIRFEKWGPRSVKEWGLKVIIGKTTMGPGTQKAMKDHSCIHATPLGVAPNLYQRSIKVKEVFWLKELGSIEAAWILELERLGPFLVDIDCNGSNYFDRLDREIEFGRKNAYASLGIPEDYEYTKLY